MRPGPDAEATAPGGETSVASLLLGFLDESTQECLRRCAVPLTFDHETFADLLRPADGPDLDTLLSAGQVEPVTAEPGRYQLTSTLREASLAAWWACENRPAALNVPLPDALSDMAARLAGIARRDGRRREELDLLLLSDPPLAARTFTKLFEGADDAHDLPWCRALLDVLDSPVRRSLLDPQLTAVRNEAATLLNARSMWTTAYYESARYVPRPQLEDFLEELLRGEPSRVAELYADGGMGKTMQVRWLIARRCSRRHDRIACARIDFDRVHPVTAARLPWLLFTEIAAQLDQQLLGAPFQEFLASYGPYRALLQRASAAATTVTPVKTLAGVAEEVAERFLDVLRELPADQPLLIVLDTMEEVIRPALDPTGLVDQLATLVRSAPSVRLLLAGRYDVRRRLANMAEVLPELRSMEVPRLSEGEQRRYLQDIRSIKQVPVVNEIIRLSEGLPFTLAVYANLVKQSDKISAEVLASFRDPGLLFAIERVLERIEEEQLQWLIRYGVLPRSLSLDFVASVILPYLPDSMAGRSALDDPRQDDRPQDRPREIFRTGVPAPADAAELRRLWDRLLEYAEEYAWVSVASDDRQMVVFRPDVVQPLRHLLRQHPIYAELQRSAAEFYERFDAQRLDCRREAIYHRFQLGPEAGSAAWRRAVAEARAAGDDEACLDLATDLLSGEYVDWTGKPIGSFPYQMLAEAQLERARAAAALAATRQVGAEDALWSDVEDGLRVAAQLVETRPDVRMSRSELIVLQARVLIARGSADEAERLLRDHRKDLAPSRELADAERALGQSLEGIRPTAAAVHFKVSYDAAVSAGDRAGARQSALLLAEAYANNDQFDAALKAVDRAVAASVVDRDDEDAALVTVWPLLSIGHADRVRQSLEPLARSDGPVRTLAQLGLALAQHFLGDDLAAVESGTEVLHLMAARTDATTDYTDGALAIRGVARSRLLAVPHALDDFLSAAARARELRDFSSAAEWTALAAGLLIDVAGDFRETQQCLDEAAHFSPEHGSTGWLNTEVVSARLAARIGRAGEARQHIRQVRLQLETLDASPSKHVTVLLAELAVTDAAEHDALFALLNQHLRDISPPAARLVVLDDMAHVPEVGRRAPALDEFVGLATDAVADYRSTGPTDRDVASVLAHFAEVLRVAGQRAEAAGVLDDIRRSRGHDPIAWWSWLEAMDRLGAAAPTEPVPPDEALDSLVQQPLLTAAYRITLADRRLDMDPIDRTIARLAPIEDLLAAVGRQTQWAARLARTRARLARRTGDQPAAHRYAAESVRISSRLGDSLQRDKVASEFELGTHVRQDDPHTFEIGVRLTERAVEVFSGSSGEETPVISLPRRELAAKLLGLESTGTSLHDQMVRDWWRWAAEAGGLLLPKELAAAFADADPDGLDVRVVPRARQLASLPWELLRGPWDSSLPLVQVDGLGVAYRSLPRAPREESKIRALQVALSRAGFFTGVPDGYVGRGTDEALRRFQREAGLEADGRAGGRTWAALIARLEEMQPSRPLRVLVLRSDPDRELQRQRGPGAFGADIAGAYLNHRALVDVIEDPTFDRVWRYCRSLGPLMPDVVHVCAAIRATGGSTVLDFGGNAGARAIVKGRTAQEELSVTAMGELISLLSRDVAAPSVVLDMPQSHTLGETVRSLLARNSFGYQLLRLGRTPAILATGLAGPDGHDDLIETLVGGITAGQSFAEVAQRITRRRPATAANRRSALPFLATAVFLQRPPFTLLPLKLQR